MKRLLFLFSFILSSVVSAKTYYVAPTGGSDSYPGTISQPWSNWQKAFNTAVAGDTVYFRGGVWYPKTSNYGNNINLIQPKSNIGHNGAPGNPICYFNYPGETPILDCRYIIAPGTYPANRYLVAIMLYDVHWIHWKGLTIRNVYQRQENVSARGFCAAPISNMIFENMTVHDTGAEGYYMESDVGSEYKSYNLGWDGSGFIPYDTTRYINCDTYQCCDTLPCNVGNDSGNMGDGMKHINLGAVISFENCRVWYASDDGFDMPGYGKTTFTNCWSFANGLSNGVPNPDYEGNGFKFGANVRDNPFPRRILTRCLAAFVKETGFFVLEYDGYARTKARLYNCTSYKNGTGYTLSENHAFSDTKTIYRNCISYGSTGLDAGGRPTLLDAVSIYTASNCNWIYQIYGSLPRWVYSSAVTVADDDFVATDYSTAIAQLTAPRPIDNSLPTVTFLTLKSTSDLIDKGTEIPVSDSSFVSLSYYGTAPDLGYSEYVSGSVTPPSPVFSWATVENATPARVDMTYSLTLANIVPAASAFVVKVNSNVRTISSVSISGNKVLLTLATPVQYGDVVTVAYTKPASNPLQTLAGGQAVSISAQNVTNNIASPTPVYVSSTVENASPSRLDITYSLTLANTVPAASAFTVKVNSVTRSVSSVAVTGTKVFLTLAGPVIFGDIVTVAYSKPATNPLQTSTGDQAATITAQPVINNCSPVSSNQPPVVSISSPTNNSVFKFPATITIDAVASDPDGSISKVEFKSGNVTIGEITTSPYRFIWENPDTGDFVITAIATDNLGAASSSPEVQFSIFDYKDYNPDLITLYPNPNNGIFTIVLSYMPNNMAKRISIISSSGKTVLNKIIMEQESPMDFELSNLSAGTYILMIVNNNSIVATKKFIIK